MSEETLFIPCETFSVNAIMSPAGSLTPLEKLILEAIHHGAESVTLLNNIFLLGVRPIQRILLDLLDRTLIAVNLETGQIRLSRQTEKKFIAGELDDLMPGQRFERRVELMRDSVAGTILRVYKWPKGSRKGRLVPALLPPLSAPKAPYSRILVTAQGFLKNRTTPGGRQLQVHEIVFQIPETALVENKRRELELRIRTDLDGRTDNLKISIIYPDDLNASTRIELEKKLNEMANRDDPSEVFKNLRHNAAPSHSPHESSLHRLFESLREQIEKLSDVERGNYGTWRTNLERAALEIEATLAHQQPGSVSFKVIWDTAEQQRTIRKLIHSAEKQVVLSCPFIDWGAAYEYRSALERAMENGRKVFLLTGMGDSLELKEGVGAWFSDWKEEHGPKFGFARQSANCHAKFVIADGHTVFLTSYNFLFKKPSATFELGICLSVDRGDATDKDREKAGFLPLAAQILNVSSEIYPGTDQPPDCLENAVAYGADKGSVVSEPDFPSWNPAVDIGEDDFSDSHARLWKYRWQQYGINLSDRVQDLGVTFDLVRDGRHRQALFDALQTAEKRLIVLSDQITTRVINREFQQELEKCLARKCRVVLCFRRPQNEALFRFDHLLKTPDFDLHIVPARSSKTSLKNSRGTHAKLLICDDWAIVTSFNFLSFSGDYEGAQKHRMRTELGLKVHGRSIVDALVQSVSEGLPDLAPLIRAHPPLTSVVENDVETATRRKPKTNIRDVAVLLEKMAGKDIEDNEDDHDGKDWKAPCLKRLFEEAGGAVAAFEELEELDAASPDFVLQAAAICLLCWDDQTPSYSNNWVNLQMRSWRIRILEDAWWNRFNPLGTLMMLAKTRIGDHKGDFPPVYIAALAARLDAHTALLRQFEDAALRVDGEYSAVAITALSLPCAFFETLAPVEALRLVRNHLPEPMLNISNLAIDFRDHYTYAIEENMLEQLIEGAESGTSIDTAQKKLLQNLQRAKNQRMGFHFGDFVWGSIVSGAFGLNQIQEAVKASDTSMVEKCIAAIGANEVEIENFLTKAEDRGKTKTKYHRAKPISRDRRRQCIERHLIPIVKSAQDWLDTKLNKNKYRTPTSLEAVYDFAESINAALPDVKAFSEKLFEHHAYPFPLVAAMLKRIEPLARLVDK